MIAKYEQRTCQNDKQIVIYAFRGLQNLSHWHVEHELVYVLSGHVEIMIRTDSYKLGAGMCALIGKEEIHYIKGDADSVVRIVKIDDKHVSAIIDDKRLACPVLENDYAIGKWLDELFDEINSGREYSDIIAVSILTRLVAQIFRSEKVVKGDNSKTDQKYRDLIEMIVENFNHVTFSDAADFMYFNKPYFSKYFYKHTGMKFTHYVNILKASAAAQMILDGQQNMTEISNRCGFGSIRNFNRVFKEYTGYIPSKLPADYSITYRYKDNSQASFNPTLDCSVAIL